jgi:hypothetical protein
VGDLIIISKVSFKNCLMAGFCMVELDCGGCNLRV